MSSRYLMLSMALAALADLALDGGPGARAEGIPPEQRAAVDHVLKTTRSVRKRLGLTRPVDPKIIEEAIDVAIQAPTGSNVQGWHFVVVTDPAEKQAIADLYRKGADLYRSQRTRPTYPPDDPRAKQQARMAASGAFLSQHMQEVPAIVFVGIEGRVETQSLAAQAATYGSVLPAAWSFMLALRARGVGATWTTLALIHEQEVRKLLQIPDNVTLAVMMPVAYYTGADFKPAKRLPARDRTHWNAWGRRRS